MAALTQARNTKQATGGLQSHPVKAGAVCIQGGIAVLSAGYAMAAAAGVGLVALGRIEETADNTGGIDGAIRVEVRPGYYQLFNSTAADLIAQADAGKDCYLVDDQTVAKTDGGGTRSRAGKVMGVDADGVWVLIGIGH